jgi:2-haloacid dehalogenase
MLYVFDAYGTLWDITQIRTAVASVIGSAASSGFLSLWRQKQLEYAFLRTMMNGYEPFSRVTSDALDYTLDNHQIRLSDRERQGLLDAWDQPVPYPDAPEALHRLRGHRRAILSNGDPAMLARGVAHSGLGGYLDAVLSVHTARRYKPHPDAYQVVLDEMQHTAAADVVFVSANGWDAAGAAEFGFRTIWINRGGQAVERLSARPWRVVSSLSEAAAAL